MEGRCGTCRHWGTHDPSMSGAPIDDVDRRGCGAMVDWERKPLLIELTAADEWGIGALTAADFGCVLWEG